MRIDGLFRRKASTSINEYVVVRKAEIKNVMSIVLAPVHMRLNVDEEFTNRSIGLIGRKSVWVKMILGGEKRGEERKDSTVFHHLLQRSVIAIVLWFRTHVVCSRLNGDTEGVDSSGRTRMRKNWKKKK